MNNFIKLMLIVPLMAINYLYAQSNVKASADLASKWELSSGDFTGKADTKMGFSVGAEFMKPMNNNVAIGGGAQFQLPRALKDASSVKFNFIPVYAVGTFLRTMETVYMVRELLDTIYIVATLNIRAVQI